MSPFRLGQNFNRKDLCNNFCVLQEWLSTFNKKRKNVQIIFLKALMNIKTEEEIFGFSQRKQKREKNTKNYQF